MGVSEHYSGGASGCSIDALRAEQYWCCYAWPSAYGTTGRRAFFVNDTGHLLATDNSVVRYTGGVTTPWSNAAFEAATSGTLACRTAANTRGVDGQLWFLVH
jgi:hypothetical protein